MGIVATLALGFVTLSACTDTPVDIGEKDPALSKSDLAAYAASWDGYAELHEFEDGTDRVRITLDEQGNGHVRFGNRELIAAATDPAGVYPPQNATSGTRAVANPSEPWSGFDYTIGNAHVEAERIRLGAAMAELFSSYCALQTPYLDTINTSEPMYHCIPNTGGGSDEDGCFVYEHAAAPGEDWNSIPKIRVSCQQSGMCMMGMGCTCSATGCGVDTTNADVELDAALDDSQENLVGTMSLGGQRITVRLKRQ
jgi:hypothetical protein